MRWQRQRVGVDHRIHHDGTVPVCKRLGKPFSHVARLFQAGVTETPEGFHVEAGLEGDSARDLNRAVLSALRKEEKRTRLRAAWSHGGTTERFFDYVSKGSRPGG